METISVITPTWSARKMRLVLEPPSYFEQSSEPHYLELVVDTHFLFLQLTQSPRTPNCHRLDLTVDFLMKDTSSYAIMEVPGTKAGTRWLIVSRPPDVDPIEYLNLIAGLNLRPAPDHQLTRQHLILGAFSLTAIITSVALFLFKRRSEQTAAAS
jgi:hypothetical protein